MILRFRVFEQTLSLQPTKAEPRQGSKNYLELQFSFSADWDKLSKYVYLQHEDVSVPHDLTDGSVVVDEYFTEQKQFNVTLFGKSADGSVEVPTNVVTIVLKEANNLWEKDAPEPQNSWIAEVIEARDATIAAADRAELAAVKQPYPDATTLTWWVWNPATNSYSDSGISVGTSSGGNGASGEDGFSPVVHLTETTEGVEIAITDKDSTKTATVKNGKDGEKGEPGKDGLTPHIGANGNWFIGDEDTGVSAGGGGSTGGGASETLVVDFTVAEDVTQIDIPVDMSASFGNAREIIIEGHFKLPTSDEATNFGKLSVKFLYSWGADGILVNELACLPTNSSSWASETSLVGGVLVKKSEEHGGHIAVYCDGAARIKNSGSDLKYSHSTTRGFWSAMQGFRINGSHNIGAGSTIKIYARE